MTTATDDTSSEAISDELKLLFEGYKRLHEKILKVNDEIVEKEASYLEETSHGNIIRGWDGFIDSKPPKKDALLHKKTKPYTDVEHLFSSSCFYGASVSPPNEEILGLPSTTSTNYPTAASTSGTSTSSKRRGSSSSLSNIGKSPSLPRNNSTQKVSTLLSGSGGSTAGTPLGTPNAIAGKGAGIKMRKRKRDSIVQIERKESTGAEEPAEQDLQ